MGTLSRTRWWRAARSTTRCWFYFQLQGSFLFGSWWTTCSLGVQFLWLESLSRATRARVWTSSSRVGCAHQTATSRSTRSPGSNAFRARTGQKHSRAWGSQTSPRARA
eukprot:Amastigsp_a519601_3.p2 type:complete len:108 gc:universal Amastigsp_a519601_3:207-530(+)